MPRCLAKSPIRNEAALTCRQIAVPCLGAGSARLAAVLRPHVADALPRLPTVPCTARLVRLRGALSEAAPSALIAIYRTCRPSGCAPILHLPIRRRAGLQTTPVNIHLW